MLVSRKATFAVKLPRETEGKSSSLFTPNDTWSIVEEIIQACT